MRARFVVPAAIVILPWAACARQPPQPAPVQAESTATQAASAVEPADSGTQATPATAIASGATTLPAAPTAVPEVEFPSPPKPTPKDRQTCAALGAKVDAFLGASQSCKTAADCVEVRTECGTQGVCGTYVTQGKDAGLKPLEDDLAAAQCFAKGVVPCPSCPPLGPPACVGGKCKATR